MNSILSNLTRVLRVNAQAQKKYRALRKHLHRMPVGYPSTLSGVELRILHAMFSADEAEAALHLDWRPQTFAEIMKKAGGNGYTEATFRSLIGSMERNGAIFTTGPSGDLRYSLHPLVIGMYEMQVKRLTPGLAHDIRHYTIHRFAMEYYATEARQMRVIPVQRSVTPQMAIAAYDDIRMIVDRAKDRIAITDCICRKAKDLLGQPCKKTERREVCMGFRDYHDQYVRNGWGRSISKKEALKLLDQNEKEGLILMPTTMQEPQAVCSCCSCCCGIQEMLSMMPRPADFVESNYRAGLKPETCRACGKCGKRCPMGAIRFEGKKAVAVDEKRCIGCGLCVSTCASGSLRLARKEEEFIPPKDHYALMELIDKNKKSMAGKATHMFRALMGFRV